MTNIKLTYYSSISLFVSFIMLILLLFVGCGAVPTSGRYENDDKSNDNSGSENQIEEITPGEEFDLKPYRPNLEVAETEFNTDTYSETADAWYEYETTSDPSEEKKIIGSTDGYRVQIIATDDIDEANQINTKVSEIITNHLTYVNFEPPFYKVKLGDFKKNSEANDMRFRLRQLGFAEAKVVRESINLFE